MTRQLLFAGVSLAVFAAHPALAQTAAPAMPATTTDPIVVVANRAPEPLSKIGQSVTVIDDAAIQSSQAVVVSDLLAQTPGLTVSRNGGEGQETSVFIRGADSDETLVLIDGVQLNDPSSPSAGYDFSNLLVGDISRIEILRGAQSTLWGSQAIGGVVNIVTAAPSGALGGDLDLQGGSRSTQDYRGDVGGTLDRLSFRLAGSYFTTAGVPAFDQYFGGRRPDGDHNAGFSGRVGYAVTPDVSLDLRGYYTRSQAAHDGYDTPNGQFGEDSEYSDTFQYIGYAGLNVRMLDGRLMNRLDVQYTDTQSKDFDPGVASYSPSTETFYGFGRNTRLEYQGTLDIADGYRAVFGAQHELSAFDTDTPAYDGGVPAPQKAHVSEDSGYAQLQAEPIRNLTLTGGLRYDQHQTFGGHATAQASAAWALNNGATLLRASFGQGFKAPSLYQLFSPYGPTPRQSLRPEVSNSWDLGVEQHFWDGRAMLSATYFGRDTRDLIEFVSTNIPPTYGVYRNLGRATAEGIELQGGLKLSQALSLSANYTYTHAVDVTGQVPLLRRPDDTANASATYLWPIKLSTALAVRYSSASHDQGYDINFNPYPVRLKAYELVDLRASYPLTGRLEVYGRIENLFDQHYETAYQYGTLGRGVFAGVRARF